MSDSSKHNPIQQTYEIFRATRTGIDRLYDAYRLGDRNTGRQLENPYENILVETAAASVESIISGREPLDGPMLETLKPWTDYELRHRLGELSIYQFIARQDEAVKKVLGETTIHAAAVDPVGHNPVWRLENGYKRLGPDSQVSGTFCEARTATGEILLQNTTNHGMESYWLIELFDDAKHAASLKIIDPVPNS